jgi:uncharacterized protein YigA (DUF484 family)
METLKTRLRAVLRDLAVPQARRLARIAGMDAEIGGLRDRVAQLEREVARLDREAQESRRLHQRLAELTDVVTEVLVPAADREDGKIREILSRYNRISF